MAGVIKVVKAERIHKFLSGFVCSWFLVSLNSKIGSWCVVEISRNAAGCFFLS